MKKNIAWIAYLVPDIQINRFINLIALIVLMLN